MKRAATFLIVPLFLLPFLTTLSQAAQTEDALKILTAADRATRAVTSAAFTVTTHGEGVYAAVAEKLSGHARVMRKNRCEPYGGCICVTGDVSNPRVPDLSSIDLRYDGSTISFLCVEKAKKVFYTGDSDTYGDTILRMYEDMWAPFLHEAPFRDEIQAQVTLFQGEEVVNGEGCYIVYVKYQPVNGHVQTARWYFSKKDKLPRKVERLYTFDTGRGARVTTYGGLRVNLPMKAESFKAIPGADCNVIVFPSLRNDLAMVVVRGYSYAVVYPNKVPQFIRENRKLFVKDGEAIKWARKLIAALRKQALQMPSTEAVRTRAADVASRCGRPDLGSKLADDMIKDKSDTLRLAAYIETLINVAPAVAAGDASAYYRTELYQLMNYVWSEAEKLILPADFKAIREITMEMNEWYVGSLAASVK